MQSERKEPIDLGIYSGVDGLTELVALLSRQGERLQSSEVIDRGREAFMLRFLREDFQEREGLVPQAQLITLIEKLPCEYVFTQYPRCVDSKREVYCMATKAVMERSYEAVRRIVALMFSDEANTLGLSAEQKVNWMLPAVSLCLELNDRRPLEDITASYGSARSFDQYFDKVLMVGLRTVTGILIVEEYLDSDRHFVPENLVRFLLENPEVVEPLVHPHSKEVAERVFVDEVVNHPEFSNFSFRTLDLFRLREHLPDIAEILIYKHLNPIQIILGSIFFWDIDILTGAFSQTTKVKTLPSASGDVFRPPIPTIVGGHGYPLDREPSGSDRPLPDSPLRQRSVRFDNS